MPIFAAFLYLLTKKANFHRMLAAEDYVDGASRKLQPVIRNDDKRCAACRRIFLLRMRQAERKQSAETKTYLAAFRRHIGKTAVFGGVCFGCYAVFAAESEEWLCAEPTLEWRQNAVRKVFAAFISSRERRRAFFAPVLQEACRESGAGGRLCNTLGRVLEAIQESVMGCLCTRRFCKNGRKSWIWRVFCHWRQGLLPMGCARPGLQRHTSDHACTQDASGALAPICFT